jgi:Starch-binding associating with outer membrane
MKKYLIVSILLLILILGGCKKSFFYNGINTNPSKITVGQLSGSPSVLLNGAENTIGYVTGGDISRYTSTIVQSVRGYNRQFAAYDQYSFNAQDFNTVWANCYTGSLNNLLVLKQISDANGYNYYSGIARVLLAYNFGQVTDLWGDVPVFHALEGNTGNISPVYDKQEVIYPYLQALLDSAVNELSGAGKGVLPGSDDVIYGGSASNWVAFAYSLKARNYLHLSKLEPAYADSVLAALAQAISSSSANASIPFYPVETSSNPWYQYIEQRSDILVAPTGNPVAPAAGSYLVDQMTLLKDPRLPVFVDSVNLVVNSYFADQAAPVTLLSYTELLFIKAEAFSAKNDPLAATVYSQAMAQSFADAGVSPGSYISENALAGITHAERLPQIIKQKYFALFTSPEPYNDWRRTGYPALTPISGTTIPGRFLYSQNELDYNGNNVPKGPTLFTKVWWGQ